MLRWSVIHCCSALLIGVCMLKISGGQYQDAGPNAPGPPVAAPAHAKVSIIDEVDVPAQEAGVLVSVEAQPGMHVQAEMRLAQIDDSQAQARKRVAEAEYQRARQQAENDVNIRFAKAAAAVADADYQQALDANKRHPNAVSPAKVRQLQLTFHKSELQIEQAEFEQRVGGLTAQARQAEADAAQLDIARRQVVSPTGGVVAEVVKRPGEWVNPGDTVLRVARLDRLYVEGFLRAADFGPQEVANQRVLVRVHLERGRVEKFAGHVVFVDFDEVGGEYQVRAEVQNRLDGDQWLLRPGAEAQMAIELAPPRLTRDGALPDVSRR